LDSFELSRIGIWSIVHQRNSLICYILRSFSSAIWFFSAVKI
jgi:hypothetical protein